MCGNDLDVWLKIQGRYDLKSAERKVGDGLNKTLEFRRLRFRDCRNCYRNLEGMRAMAKRPRQHQLEDESITAFRSVRPSLWPVRKKDEDYGIDLEVEIFDSDEESTGLIFFVQLKATDAEEGRSVVLAKDYLDGICQYESPTIIVRYFARDRRLYWSWASDLRAEIPEEQASKTFHFSDDQSLDAQAFREIEHALVVTRQLESIEPSSALGIRLDIEGLQGRRKLQLRRSLEQIEAAETPAISFYEAEGPKLREGIVLEVRDNAVRLSFGPRYTALLEIDEHLSVDVVAGRALYSIAHMMDIVRLPLHAVRLAKNLLELGIKTDVRMQAAQVALALRSDPDAYVKLATLNDLHRLQDVAYLSVLFGIYESPGHRSGISRHGIRFLEAALESASKDGPQAEGVILYSMANAARQIDTRFAFSLYLRAKRKKPEYKEIGYFQRELAGTLFILERFSCSRILYSRSGIDADSPLDALIYGDACLFSGHVDEAIHLFGLVKEAPDVVLQAEGEIKLWLARKLGSSAEGNYRISGLTESFNIGVSLARASSYEEALRHFLPCCLLSPNDHESWINAAICCHNMKDMSLYAHLLIVGFSLEGEALLHSVMSEFENRGADDQMYDLLSQAYAIVRSIDPTIGDQAKRRRESNFDVVIPIEGE